MSTFNIAFNILYKEYHKKDYFGNKKVLRDKLSYAKKNNIKVRYSDVKNYLLHEKKKCYDFMIKRLNKYVNTGKHYPKREKFTHALFKMLKV